MTIPIDRREPLHTATRRGLADGCVDSLAGRTALDRRDRFLTLLCIYDLHLAPIDTVAVRFQHHPAITALKAGLEADWLVELERLQVPAAEDVTSGIRGIAVDDRLPEAYRWLAQDASWSELVDFLALEGGPDGGFDDLVALCQVGLTGSAKLELGKNYWDEMGGGSAEGVHTQLHHDLVAALDLPTVPLDLQPVEALERAALNGLLATNRWLQPEMLGALGLTELQAGPRCRLVLKAFDRLGAPAAAYPFYVEHAEVDPVHGKDWVEKALVPTVAEKPEWGPRILRGAAWRAQVNLAFFSAAHAQVQDRESKVA